MEDFVLWTRSVVIPLLLAIAACGRPDEKLSSASDQPAHTPPELSKQVPQDAALPPLAPAREAFWARFLGADGAPGPEMLSFCRDPKIRKEAVVDIAPGVTMAREAVDSCQLVVAKPAIEEVRTVLHRWNATAIVDATHQLNVNVGEQPNFFFVHWDAYVPLEQIVGSDGRVLVGFDVKKVLGKSPKAMRDAVSKPLVAESDCTDGGCAAYGQRPPGSVPVRIGMVRNSPDIVATIGTTTELVPRLHALLDASLGPGRQEGPVSIHVHHHDGVRYEVRDSRDYPVVKVIISVDTP